VEFDSSLTTLSLKWLLQGRVLKTDDDAMPHETVQVNCIMQHPKPRAKDISKPEFSGIDS
jgi:hypothetical protein